MGNWKETLLVRIIMCLLPNGKVILLTDYLKKSTVSKWGLSDNF